MDDPVSYKRNGLLLSRSCRDVSSPPRRGEVGSLLAMRSIVQSDPGEGPQFYRGTVTPHPALRADLSRWERCHLRRHDELSESHHSTYLTSDAARAAENPACAHVAAG